MKGKIGYGTKDKEDQAVKARTKDYFKSNKGNSSLEKRSDVLDNSKSSDKGS